MELKTFKTLQCNSTRIFDINSSIRMFIQCTILLLKLIYLISILVYSKPWHIQNQRYVQNLVKHLRGSVFQKLFSQYQLFTFSTFLNESIFFSNSIWPRGPETVNFDIPTLYLKTIRKKQGVSKKMPCCHFLLIVI